MVMKPRLKRQLTAAQIIVIGFFTVIVIGTLLLMLPISSYNNNATSLETAMFTSVSATCVTGLIIEDTMTYWSTFGQIVIICMIQIGGLGFMTITVLLSIIVKRTITPRERVVIAQSLGLYTFEGTIKLVKRILFGTFIVELIGAIFLSTQFIPIFGFKQGIYSSIFHSISSFCNAGFDLMGSYSGKFSGLTGFHNNYVVCITIMVLIVIGGIGFIIWDDIVNYIKSKKKISVYSKFVVLLTTILILCGALIILAFEWNNKDTIGNMPVGEKILCSFFQSITTRTAGYNTIDNSLMTDGSIIISMMLMFIGGASGSTAGGIKVVTFGIIIFTVIRVAKGNSDIVLFKRKISINNFLRAVSISVIAFLMIFISSFTISMYDNVDFIDAMFESFSAFGTVGLSLSLTPSLSLVSHIVLMAMMFLGRVGILTITYAILLRISNNNSCITYPESQILIG